VQGQWYCSDQAPQPKEVVQQKMPQDLNSAQRDLLQMLHLAHWPLAKRLMTYQWLWRPSGLLLLG
jgi:hypothetical protein